MSLSTLLKSLISILKAPLIISCIYFFFSSSLWICLLYYSDSNYSLPNDPYIDWRPIDFIELSVLKLSESYFSNSRRAIVLLEFSRYSDLSLIIFIIIWARSCFVIFSIISYSNIIFGEIWIPVPFLVTYYFSAAFGDIYFTKSLLVFILLSIDFALWNFLFKIEFDFKSNWIFGNSDSPFSVCFFLDLEADFLSVISALGGVGRSDFLRSEIFT